MIDWDLVAKIAGGGFGVTILVLIVLSLATWVMGLIIKRTTNATTGSNDSSDSG